MELSIKIASLDESKELAKLSSEKLVIWIVGRSNKMGLKFSPEEIVIESW